MIEPNRASDASTLHAGAAELLALLADGELHSGALLAERMGVSRAAIWKRIHKLQSEGFHVETARGRGYRLVSAVEFLDRSRIRDLLSDATQSSVTSLEIERTVGSTNTVLLRKLRGGMVGHGAVMFAEQQTEGRGRRGRRWVSPFARNIYCSFIWCFETGISGLDGLSLVIGIAVVRALSSVGVGGLSVKWPNDVLAKNAKLAGVLIEVDGDMTGPTHAVIGVGVNVSMSPALGEDIDQPWTDVRVVTGKVIGRNEIAAALLNACFDSLADFCHHGFGAFHGNWAELDALRDQYVTLTSGPGRSVHGRAMGVDSSGALLLLTDDGVRDFHGGEVSLRLSV